MPAELAMTRSASASTKRALSWMARSEGSHGISRQKGLLRRDNAEEERRLKCTANSDSFSSTAASRWPKDSSVKAASVAFCMSGCKSILSPERRSSTAPSSSAIE